MGLWINWGISTDLSIQVWWTRNALWNFSKNLWMCTISQARQIWLWTMEKSNSVGSESEKAFAWNNHLIYWNIKTTCLSHMMIGQPPSKASLSRFLRVRRWLSLANQDLANRLFSVYCTDSMTWSQERGESSLMVKTFGMSRKNLYARLLAWFPKIRYFSMPALHITLGK